ncbi:MAG: tRNA (cytidine(34)-2'-O)-methyltransferase [Deltaproteobacteria bacterium]|nr:MAG: tRNA (cytidine(34)-2'-O)-methyltransferase [Deltaproteobacteria bacterium]
MFHLVLVEPEIPQNTGNIGRLCLAVHATLHLVGPLGFRLDEKAVRRAGLDYWKHVRYRRHPSFEALRAAYPEATFRFFSTKGQRCYTDVAYQPGDFLVFGRESTGLPPSLFDPAEALHIPIFGPVRSLNLASSVAIVVYEGIRQLRGTVPPQLPGVSP